MCVEANADRVESEVGSVGSKEIKLESCHGYCRLTVDAAKLHSSQAAAAAAVSLARERESEREPEQVANATDAAHAAHL